MSKLQSLHYSRGHLEILDQLLLPHKSVYEEVKTHEDGWSVIRSMKVRGAPLIAIVACLSLAVELEQLRKSKTFNTIEELSTFLQNAFAHLKTSRPTAVNLFTALDSLTNFVNTSKITNVDELIEAIIVETEIMLEKDVADNKAIGRFGAEAIVAHHKDSSKTEFKVLTHCNAGSLATAGYGTAVGVIRALFEQKRIAHAFCTETRPYNQGARLTAYELVTEEIPSSLICDSMAAALMKLKGIDAVVVGADRVAANGDTANKIGTYSLAILAQYHRVPLFIAVPSTSIDLTLSTGDQIPIETRAPHELTDINGVRIAADGIGVWNPSFDVTPAELITGLVTEKGVIYKTNGVFEVAKFLQQP
eukprot:GCRY01001893.1.p1 GENE.GCRY01001893.1~~GCRY01001893.1.p1  ORF type:complete len:362 (+),score=89.82 GCRY01001893.1:55-1140(+)